MTQITPAFLAGTVPAAEITSTTAHAALFPGFAFTLRDWLLLMDAIGGQPSCRRDDVCGETIDCQQSRLPALVADACWENGVSLALAMQVEALSVDARIAILEAAERFWKPTGIAETLEAKLARIGLHPVCIGADRLRAARLRMGHEGNALLSGAALPARPEEMTLDQPPAGFDLGDPDEPDAFDDFDEAEEFDETDDFEAFDELDESETQDPLPAYICRQASPPAPDLPGLDAARPGDVLALVSRYRAAFEERPDLQRELEGFYLAGETGPVFKTYKDLPKDSRAVAAQLALDHLFLGPDLHAEVLGHEMVCEPMLYDLLVVTFADARVLVETDVLHDPDEVRLALLETPDLAPCVIEICGGEEGPALRAKAARYLEIARSMLPESARAEALNLDLRLHRGH